MDVTKIVYLVLSLTLSSILFFVVTPWVFSDLNDYRLKKSTKTFSKKESIVLVDGMCNFNSSNTINTSNNFQRNYVDMPLSVNKEGGTEFSYTFWIKFDSTLPSEVVLFTKGSNPKTGTTRSKFHKVFDKNGVDTNVELTQCPMVKLTSKDIESTGSTGITGKTPEKLTVSFNTSRKIHNEVVFDINNSSISNLLLSTDNNPRWFLFTVAFREGDFETEYGMKTKGVIVDLFVNEQHVKNKFIENDTIKLNKGDIYIFPDPGSSSNNNTDGCKLGNIYYYNWNLTAEDVIGVFSNGPNTKDGCSVAGSKVVNTQINSLGRHGASLFF